ncbi:MAG TPA: hypothetical protein VHR17_17855, partial [Thermoanaerobaculia bacterium]|nr:hypothetical protein [Thermoanaerobaculia bacterium]
MKRRSQHRLPPGSIFVAAALLVSSATALVAESAAAERGKKRGDRFTAEFRLDDCTFVTNDDDSPGNPFFPLVPGNQIV